MDNKYQIGDRVRVLTVNEVVKLTGILKSGYGAGDGYFYNISINDKIVQRIPEDWITERVS